MTRGLPSRHGPRSSSGRFGRMFPNLAAAPDSVELARTLGRVGGPLEIIGGNNLNLPAGFTYLGQFIDHDLSFDTTSSLERQNDVQALRNFRTAAFELDNLYGAGPEAQPYFYDRSRHGFLLLNDSRLDLPRLPNEMAVIADPRNDENFIVSQLHVAMLNFHNYVCDRVGGDFVTAQREVRWHYQWIVRNQYLSSVVQADVILDIEAYGPRFFRWCGSDPFLPVEFAVAAFRFGHAQIRSSYDIGFEESDQNKTLGELFGPNAIGRLGRPLDWRQFFSFPDQMGPRFSHPIIPGVVRQLLELPEPLIRRDGHGPHPANTADDFERSVVYLDIRRGQACGLPDGTSIARFIGLSGDKILEPEVVWAEINEDLDMADRIDPSTPVPLWLYILKEAEQFQEGERLGPVGSRIVAEVFIGLLRADSESFVSKRPDWRPTLGEDVVRPGRDQNPFDIVDLLTLAGRAATAGSPK